MDKWDLLCSQEDDFCLFIDITSLKEKGSMETGPWEAKAHTSEDEEGLFSDTHQDLKAEVNKRYLPKTFCQDEEESFPKVKGEHLSTGELMTTTMERQAVWALGWLFPKESGIKGPAKET